MNRNYDNPEYKARHAAEEPSTTEEQSTTTEFPMVDGPKRPIESVILPPVEEEPVPEKKRRGLFRRRERRVPLLTEGDAIETGDDVRVAEEAPAVSDDTQEVSLSANDEGMESTRVIELAEQGGSELAEEETEGAQLFLDGFGAIDETIVVEPRPEENLRRIREEKIQSFSQRREQHERELAEAAEAAEAAMVSQDEEPEELVEEESVQETMETLSLSALRVQLQQKQHRSGVTLLVSAVLEGILFLMAAVASLSGAVALNPVTYLILHLVLFGGLLAANYRQLLSGLTVLFRQKRVTTEGVIAVTSVLTFVHTVLLVLNTSGVFDGSSPVLTGVAGFGLLLLQIVHRLQLNREIRDLAIFATEGEKLVVKHITDAVTAEEIGRPAVALGVPRVAYFRRTAETEGYIAPTGFDPAAGFLGWYLPVVAGVSLVASVVYLLLNGVTTWIFAVSLLCGMLVTSAPMMLLLALCTMLFAADRNAREQGAAIADYRAVEQYGNMHAVAFDAMELFPENSVLLHGIKTFSGTRIDEAILDAASVSIRAGGPLSHLFRRMIINKVDMLHEVDTLVYEQDMGLSGWISGRRILIGNRRLLDNHGIDIPSKDYEERYTKNGRQLVYLSIAGELSAMFVVSYTADPEVRRVLKTLTERRITLLIRTCDQNITEALITSVFNLNGFYVELLNAPAGRSFETLVAGTTESEPAEIVAADGALGMLSALAQCRRMRTGIRVFTVLQAIGGIAAMVLVALRAFVDGTPLSPLGAIEFLAGSAMVLSLLSLVFAKE